MLNPARAAAGLDGVPEAGDPGFRDAFAALLAAFEHEADLCLFGRLAARWDVARFLRNLRTLHAAERAHPEVLQEPIARPIFITGLPRSGSTFLHSLMAEDPRLRAPLCWQTVYPYPRRSWLGRDDRARRVERQLRGFARLAPGFASVHPIGATSPQECTEITAHVFRSLRFDATHHVPSYRRWLDAAGHAPAYRFHRRFLQHLQFQAGQDQAGQVQSGPGQWVLKCPDHVFALDALLAEYPDARIVFTHRDPLRVLPSVAKLTEILRRPFARHVDRAQIGRQVSRDWQEGARRIMQASLPPERVAHVQYEELVARPFETVAAIYRHFGLDIGPAAARIRAAIAAHPDGGYGRNRYSFAEFGLDPGDMRDRFAAYLRHFDVRPEPA